MFTRFFTTSLLAIYLALAIGGPAAHRLQHMGSKALCCQNEGELSRSGTANEDACSSPVMAASHGCPEKPQSNHGQDDEDSSDCLTCCVLSQVADTSAAEILPLGVAATFLKINGYQGLYLEASRLGFKSRGPPAFLL